MNYFRRLWLALLGRDHELQDVRDFQRKFGQLDYDHPFFLSRRKLQERVKFLQEELDELLTASTLDDQADALVDLVYVAKGTACMMGLPWEKLWADVQRANMAKVRGTTHRGNKVDVMKPEGWVPPMGGRILYEAGYEYGATPWSKIPDAICRDDQENRP